MVKNNPFTPIIFSITAIFCVFAIPIYCHVEAVRDTLSGPIKLKNFDTIMGVGAGVNLALGTLKGIRDGICNHYKLRFDGVRTDMLDKLKSLVSWGKFDENLVKGTENVLDSLQLSIEDNKTHGRVQNFTAWLSVGVAVIYCFGLTVAAFNPDFAYHGWLGVPIVLFILIPIGCYVLSISVLAAYPEYKAHKHLQTVQGLSDMLKDLKVEIKPILPKA